MLFIPIITSIDVFGRNLINFSSDKLKKSPTNIRCTDGLSLYCGYRFYTPFKCGFFFCFSQLNDQELETRTLLTSTENYSKRGEGKISHEQGNIDQGRGEIEIENQSRSRIENCKPIHE